jgi:hypothetical protein
MSKFIDLTGNKFGMLTVTKFSHFNKRRVSTWECLCECGNNVIVIGSNMKNGNSKSCGCLNIERAIETNTTHGMRRTRIYSIWIHMKERCRYEKCSVYEYYGGRGINYCEDWEKFEGFYRDMKDGYSDRLTLERKDVNGNYCKENCKWATKIEQANNTRTNRIETVDGVADTMANLCRIYNIDRSVVKSRLKLGWSLDSAFMKPVKKIKQRA